MAAMPDQPLHEGRGIGLHHLLGRDLRTRIGISDHGVGHPDQIHHDEFAPVIVFEEFAHDRQVIEIAAALGFGLGQHGVDLFARELAAPIVVEQEEAGVQRGSD